MTIEECLRYSAGMPERPAGFEREEIDKGFQALAKVQSAEDLDRIIASMPVLRSPMFHAQLRQYRLTNMAELAKHPGALEGFMQVARS
jgi:hypothetical protein